VPVGAICTKSVVSASIASKENGFTAPVISKNMASATQTKDLSPLELSGRNLISFIFQIQWLLMSLLR
jgi:hypothetical protein